MTNSSAVQFELSANQNKAEIPEDILIVNWTLTADDIDFIHKSCRGDDASFICFALQICQLRNAGRFIDNYTKIPLQAVVYIANQLEMNFVSCVPEKLNLKTEHEYRKKAIGYLKFRPFDQHAIEMLNCFLVDQLRVDLFSQESLTTTAEAFLVEHKILLPQPISLGRKIAKARKSALLIIYSRIADKLDAKQKKKCDKMIRTSQVQTLTDLQKFKGSPPEPTAKVINDYLDRLSILSKLRIHKVELADINPKMVMAIAGLVKTYKAHAIRRMTPPQKRYAYLVCFLTEAYKTLVDHIIELNDRFLLKKERISRHDLQQKMDPLRRRGAVGSELIVDTVKKLIDCANSDTTTIADFKANLEIGKIEQAIEDCSTLNGLEHHGYYHELMARYPNLRQYTKRFYKLDFMAVKGSEHLVKSIHLLRKIDEGKISALPSDTPMNFVPADWKKHLKNEAGEIVQKTWEMALNLAVKKALNSGDLYIAQSRHYRSFWQTIYGKKVWQELTFPRIFSVNHKFHLLRYPTAG